MIGINYSDYERYGCPNCGCDSAVAGSFVCRGEQTGTCQHCKLTFVLMPDATKITSTRFGTGRKDENGQDIMEAIKCSIHPRTGTPKWKYVRPDLRPPEGEYWSPRGIGYDLSGFVKSKQAGERLLEMVQEVLGKDEPETWLDYREREPNWIQFKFQSSEFDLEKLYDMTHETKIITKEIIKECKK